MADNFHADIPNKEGTEYRRHLPRDFEPASKGDIPYKNESNSLEWVRNVDFQPALDVIEASTAPPTTNDGDIYALNGGSPHSDWSVDTSHPWVKYDADTSRWNKIDPNPGDKVYSLDDRITYNYQGTTLGWEIRPVHTAKVTLSSDFTYNNNIWEDIAFDSEVWNPLNEYDTNAGEYQPTAKGFYLAVLQVTFMAGNTGTYGIRILKNNNIRALQAENFGAQTNDMTINCQAIISMDGDTDTLTPQVFDDANDNYINGGNNQTHFEVINIQNL